MRIKRKKSNLDSPVGKYLKTVWDEYLAASIRLQEMEETGLALEGQVVLANGSRNLKSQVSAFEINNTRIDYVCEKH